MKYFSPKKPSSLRAPQSVKPQVLSGSRQMALSLGTLVSGKSYRWLDQDLSGWNVEASYSPKSSGYLGRSFSLEWQKFNDGLEELNKISFLVHFSFPRQVSFPVYIGIAAGPGFFLQQAQSESEFTLDYKAYLGLRLNDIRSQYFIQSGVKNHVHMLSDGQFIGWFISSGVAYKF